MLQLSALLTNRPLLSLRTSSQIGTVLGPIINPNNLQVEAFYCQANFTNRQLILLEQDIRDIIAQGFVVNDQDALSEPDDLVRLQTTLQLNFQLLGKPVVTSTGSHIGKVSDFSTEIPSMFIKKLYVSQSIFKSLSNSNLGVDRSQIVEITRKKIVINDLHGTVPARVNAMA
jgi:uncharacterized protein YrrD